MRAEEEREVDTYACQRVQDALAHDPRVSTLGLEVRLVGADEVVVSGEVATAGQRDAVSDVAAAELPGRRVHNQVMVTPVADTARVEELS